MLAVLLSAAMIQPLPDAATRLGEPGISADGARIAFVANGDVYVVSASGGTARRVVDDPVNALHPRFSPGGDRLAYTSLRTGDGDVYVLDLATSTERRLTFHSARDAVESWDPTAEHVYFSSGRADISGNTDVFAVPVDGGTPFPVSRARYESEYNASVSPDGRLLAFNVNDRVRQWYRTGPRTDDATDVWIRSTSPSANDFERITSYEGKDSWPRWSPAGDGVYLVTDEGSPNGAENLVFQALTGERRPVTNFRNGRVSWPTIAADGTIAFEREMAIWTVREGMSAERVDIVLPVAAPETSRTETLADVSEFHAGHGRETVVVIHGDVLLESPAGLRRITATPGPEEGARLSPDGRRVAYSALRGDCFDVFIHDVATGTETRLTATPATESTLRFSPDGARLAFVEGAERIRVIDLAAGSVVDVASGFMLAPEYAWSPDGLSIAYVISDGNWLSNVWRSPSDGSGAAVQLTDFPDVYFAGLRWPREGRSLLLSTWTTRETRQVARIPADGPWAARPGAGAEYLLPPNEALILEDVAADGSTALLSGSSLGEPGLWNASLEDDGLRGFTRIASAPVRSAAIRDDGARIYLAGGRLHVLAVGSDEPVTLKLSAQFVVDPAAHRLARFRQAWLVLRDTCGDGTLRGGDWEDLYRRYEPYVRGARTDVDFVTVLRLMLGELNASHFDLAADPSLDVAPVGDLGVDFDGAALASGRFVVSSTLPLPPAGSGALRVGDRLDRIDGSPLAPGVNLSRLLLDRAGGTVSVDVVRNDQHIRVDVPARSTGEVASARYRAWVAGNEQLVEETSGGRFVYVHRRHFGAGATEDLRRQLGAAALRKQGVLLDIRYNGGGIESARAIGFLRRRVVHFSAFRDRVVAPGALVHGIPVLDRPVVLVQNGQVLSDAESFSHQFRTLGVGPVVGTRTSAWNRGERSYTLFDGTRISVGAWRALTETGEDMERRGREPDVFVDRSLAETRDGRDSQLEAAIRTLDTWIEAHGTRKEPEQ